MGIFIISFLVVYGLVSTIQHNYIARAREHLKPEFKEKTASIFKRNHFFEEDEAYEDEEGLMYRDRAERLGKIGLYFFITWIMLLFSGIFSN